HHPAHAVVAHRRAASGRSVGGSRARGCRHGAAVPALGKDADLSWHGERPAKKIRAASQSHAVDRQSTKKSPKRGGSSSMTPKQKQPQAPDAAQNTDAHIRFFEAARPRLLGIAYRILGSRAEAEDAVQDTFLRWQAADVANIDSPGAWLTTACTRRAIDMLRAAYRSRVDYVGN